MKKALFLPFVLALACFGQSQYVTMTTANGVITFHNVSGQAIVGIVGAINLNGKPTGTNTDFTVNNFRHDAFFEDGGFAAGSSFDFDTKNQPTDTPKNYTVVLSYIQFADGTSWGDKTTAALLFSHRAMALNVLTTLHDAASSPSQFVTVVNAPQSDVDMNRLYGRYRWLNTNVGTAEAIAQVQSRYAVGTARMNSGKF